MAMQKWLMIGCAGALLLAGCDSTSNIQRQQKISRANYGNEVISTAINDTNNGTSSVGKPGSATGGTVQGGTAVQGGSALQGGGPAMPGSGTSERIIGTWEFTTPPTIARNKKSTEEFDQYSLYASSTDPAATPLLVITTGNDLKSLVEAAPDDYVVKQSRTYLLNGLPAKEYNGFTKDGRRFCEILLTHGHGDDLHAMAIAKTGEQAKTALTIMGSITWKPNK